MLGYKKVFIRKTKSGNSIYGVATLKICYTSMVISGQDSQFPDQKKFRCDRVRVLKIEQCRRNEHGNGFVLTKKKVNKAFPYHPDRRSSGLKYIVDTYAYVSDFTKEIATCASGIHFFMTKKEALNYE